MSNKERTNRYHAHIDASHSLFDLKLGELWKYRDLVWRYTKKDLVRRYKQTILGPLWIIINPIITSLIYVFLFGGIAGLSTDGVPQILFYMSGNAIWTFFSSCVTRNASTFTSNAHVFGKVYFPRLSIPISNMLVAGIRFFIQMLMLAGFLVYFLI